MKIFLCQPIYFKHTTSSWMNVSLSKHVILLLVTQSIAHLVSDQSALCKKINFIQQVIRNINPLQNVDANLPQTAFDFNQIQMVFT